MAADMLAGYAMGASAEVQIIAHDKVLSGGWMP
jgi:hypothetical protein